MNPYYNSLFRAYPISGPYMSAYSGYISPPMVSYNPYISGYAGITPYMSGYNSPYMSGYLPGYIPSPLGGYFYR
jgi:hypothetical protein